MYSQCKGALFVIAMHGLPTREEGDLKMGDLKERERENGSGEGWIGFFQYLNQPFLPIKEHYAL